MLEHIETVIVGGGQAGLATSYHLMQNGREHLILEQAAQAANVWRDQRWDSFTLVTPNWSVKMPGAEYHGPDPNGFMPRAEIIAYFEKYVEQFQLPIDCNTRVLSIEPLDGKEFHGKERGHRDWFFPETKNPKICKWLFPGYYTTPQQRIPQSRITPARGGPHRRQCAIGLSDRRGTLSTRPKSFSLYRQCRPGAASLPRQGCDRMAGPDRTH